MRLLHGVGITESGHDYGAIGPDTGNGRRAYGKYQVMDYNVGPWTEQYLGVRMSVEAFLKDTLAQEKLAGMIFTERIGTHKNLHDPIAIWFSGRPATGNEACDVNTCTPNYIRQVLISML